MASDGGLFIPKSWPELSPKKLETMQDNHYARIAAYVLKQFTGDNIPEEDLPSVGTLISADDKRYLAISFVEDIAAGTKEAKRLGAILCCPREVIA